MQIKKQATRQIVVARNTLKTSLSAYRRIDGTGRRRPQTTFRRALTAAIAMAVREIIITDVTLASASASWRLRRCNGRRQHSAVGCGDTRVGGRRAGSAPPRRRRIGSGARHACIGAGGLAETRPRRKVSRPPAPRLPAIPGCRVSIWRAIGEARRKGARRVCGETSASVLRAAWWRC